jgi:hypothetical protein
MLEREREEIAPVESVCRYAGRQPAEADDRHVVAFAGEGLLRA